MSLVLMSPSDIHPPPIGYYAESERELDFACLSFQSPQAIEVKYVTELEWHDKRREKIRSPLKNLRPYGFIMNLFQEIEKQMIVWEKVLISRQCIFIGYPKLANLAIKRKKSKRTSSILLVSIPSVKLI